MLERGLINEVDLSPDFTETRLLESCSGLPAATAAEIEPNRQDDVMHITHLSTSCDITICMLDILFMQPSSKRNPLLKESLIKAIFFCYAQMLIIKGKKIRLNLLD